MTWPRKINITAYWFLVSLCQSEQGIGGWANWISQRKRANGHPTGLRSTDSEVTEKLITCSALRSAWSWPAAPTRTTRVSTFGSMSARDGEQGRLVNPEDIEIIGIEQLDWQYIGKICIITATLWCKENEMYRWKRKTTTWRGDGRHTYKMIYRNPQSRRGEG